MKGFCDCQIMYTREYRVAPGAQVFCGDCGLPLTPGNEYYIISRWKMMADKRM